MKSLHRTVRKRRCVIRAMSVSGGYAFIRCDGNLDCIISVHLTLSVGIHIQRKGRKFLAQGLTLRAAEDLGGVILAVTASEKDAMSCKDDLHW